MAMHKPCPWVVGFQGYCDEAVSRKQDHVSSRRIVEVEGDIALLRIKGLIALRQKNDIHTVPMKGMRYYKHIR